MGDQQHFIGKLELFDPDTDDWDRFVERIENYFDINKIEDSAFKAKLMMNLMGKETYSRIRLMVVPKNINDLSYEELVKAGNNLFTKTVNAIILKSVEFHNMKQRSGETYADFVMRLHKVGEQCKFIDLDRQLRDKFIAGIRNNDIRTKVMNIAKEESTFQFVALKAEEYSNLSQTMSETDQQMQNPASLTLLLQQTSEEALHSAPQSVQQVTQNVQQSALKSGNIRCQQQNVKLHESENPWRPRHLAPQSVTPDDISNLCKRFRSILNKLTPENFEVLVNEVKALKIDTDKKLDVVTDLLFEKAISEPKFAPIYALLCREVGYIFHIPGRKENQSTTQTKKSAFKVKLITQCQKEFERHKVESKVFNEIAEEMSKIGELNDLEKEEKKALLEEKHYRNRQRANGTVIFMGELYKIDMLTVKIMRQCVLILLESPTEEKIERVCKLLTVIGHKMETEAGPEGLNPYFQVLQELLGPNRKEIRSSRIRFEIQNLQDLTPCLISILTKFLSCNFTRLPSIQFDLISN